MSLKSQVASIANEIGKRADDWPDRMDQTRKALSEWGDGARDFVRKNPGATVIGAFLVGFVLAKVARYA